MTVDIDPHSGFCGGVIRAIGTAENVLAEQGRLYSLGAIVHNGEELDRLGRKGLKTIGIDDVATLPAGSHVLIRAHGEPPATYQRLNELSLMVHDCTCPVVLRLQKLVREAAGRSKVVIYGRIGHPEVLGLLGQTGGSALVVESAVQLAAEIQKGALDGAAAVELFSQTTGNPQEYARVAELLGTVPGVRLTVHDSICAQVSGRHKELEAFAREHDVVVFVAGADSSNGKVLFERCLGANPRCHKVQSASELRPEWFAGASSAGVCGATSTPRWLLEEVAEKIR